MDKHREIQQFLEMFRAPKPKGRPLRNEPINLDDILNLKIALALSKDVLDFLQDHHIFKV